MQKHKHCMAKMQMPFPSIAHVCVSLLLCSCFFEVSSTRVHFLPGFQGPLPFQLHTGYISVGERDENHLFYYFVKSERNPAEDPLVLWISGGPGSSSFTGLAFEVGPLRFVVKELKGSLPQLILNQYSWTKVANIIFLDAPSGSGFSYSNSKEDYITGDFKAAKDNYRFLVKWLDKHPEFLCNPLYIGGDSYSGMPIPYLVHLIAKDKEAGNEPRLNLKGYILGNPLTDQKFDKTFVPYAHGMGLISDELYQATRQSCRGRYDIAQNSECGSNIEAVTQHVSGINYEHILEKNCSRSNSPYLRRSLNVPREHDGTPDLLKHHVYPIDCPEYLYTLSDYWANDMSVREALHIREGTIGEWVRNNYSIPLIYSYDVKSAIKYHKYLTSTGYRALVYSGDHDAVIPFIGTRQWIDSLNYTVIDQWRSWWVNNQIAGFTRSFDRDITFATVKGGGHLATLDRPKECFAMAERWLSYSAL